MALFTTFKIRDLMVSVRPGWCGPTPEQPLECEGSCDGCSDTVCGGRSIGCGFGGCSFFTCAESCEVCSACTAVTCGHCSHCTATCGHSCGHCSGGCTATCQGATHPPPALLCAGTGCIASDPGVITRMAADDLAVLKNQLRIAMQQVDRREETLRAAAQGAALQPQTISEVDALEKKLSEALDELRARRAELQKRSEEGNATGGASK
jgi:hypothetical protein